MRSRDKRIAGEDPVGPAEKLFSFFKSNPNPKGSLYRSEGTQGRIQELQGHLDVTTSLICAPAACKRLPDEVQNLKP
jgi:hypothetical protein